MNEPCPPVGDVAMAHEMEDAKYSRKMGAARWD